MATPAPPKGVPLRAGGCSPWDVVVPTDELAAVLIPAVDRFNAELNFTEYETAETKDGALKIIGERSAAWLGIRPDSIPRRIYGIRTQEFKSCNVRHADAFLLALDIYIGEHEITHLPNGKAAAIEMIEAYNAERGLRPRRAEVEALAKKLLRFKNGYLHHEKYLAQAEQKVEANRWIEERRTEREEAQLAAA